MTTLVKVLLTILVALLILIMIPIVCISLLFGGFILKGIICLAAIIFVAWVIVDAITRKDTVD